MAQELNLTGGNNKMPTSSGIKAMESLVEKGWNVLVSVVE